MLTIGQRVVCPFTGPIHTGSQSLVASALHEWEVGAPIFAGLPDQADRYHSLGRLRSSNDHDLESTWSAPEEISDGGYIVQPTDWLMVPAWMKPTLHTQYRANRQAVATAAGTTMLVETGPPQQLIRLRVPKPTSRYVDRLREFYGAVVAAGLPTICLVDARRRLRFVSLVTDSIEWVEGPLLPGEPADILVSVGERL